MKEKKGEVFEKLIVRLEEIVDEIERKDISLEDAIKKFEEGLTVGKTCFEQLKTAEEKVKVLIGSSDTFSFEDLETI